MKPNSTNTSLPDHDSDLEDDALWSLLDQGSPISPSPTFVQDTLRRARLEPNTQAWWKSLFTTPARLWTAALTGSAVAAVALFLTFHTEPTVPPLTVDPAPAPATQLSELEDALASELLSDAAEDPTLLSDQELVALLY